MTKRKTFDVQRFKDYINGSLKFDYNDSEKRAFIQMLEYVLEETGNYKGFRYVYTDNERPCLDDPIDGKVCNPNWTKRHELMRHYF
jgi:hypothetical protein